MSKDSASLANFPHMSYFNIAMTKFSNLFQNHQQAARSDACHYLQDSKVCSTIVLVAIQGMDFKVLRGYQDLHIAK